MADGIILERDGGVARITLSRPEVGNALDVAMARALLEAAIACDEDDAVRCVLLTGAGRLFCAGGDVAAFSSEGERLPAMLKEITAYLHAAMARLAGMAKPVVGAVNGAAAGAGIGLAAVGDVVLADPKASFTLAYSGIGLSPDGGTTWLLPRLIGLRRAQEMCLTNRRVGAAEAAEIGLVTRLSADGAVVAEADALARRLAEGPTVALGATRRLLAASGAASLEAQMEAETRAIAAQSRTADGREGIAAFLAKRPAAFTGA